MNNIRYAAAAASVLLTWLSGLTALKQELPLEYQNLRECEDFVSSRQWGRHTQTCCQNHPGTTFHCQEHDGKVITACLQPRTCPPGTFPKLTEERENNSRNVSLVCQQCHQGFYEDRPKPSFYYRFPTCPRAKQNCASPKTDGKVPTSQGDSAHDTRCRCSWKQGWIPRSSSPTKCWDPAGFVHDDECYCQKHLCQYGMQLNQDYKCIPYTTASTTVDPIVESKAPKTGWVPEDKSFPGGLKPKETDSRVSRTILYVFYSLVAGGLFLFPFIMCYLR